MTSETGAVSASSRSLGTGSRAVVRALLPDETPGATSAARRRQLISGIPRPTMEQAWLMLSVLGRALPTSDEVESASRLARHQGTGALLARIANDRRRPGALARRPVEVVADAILLDVHDSATTRLGTGAQRVAREIGLDWSERDAVQLVGWTPTRTGLLRIDADRFRSREPHGMFGANPIVPWGGRYVLVESLNEPARAARIQAMAAYSGVAASMTGNDAIPLTTAETTGPRMPGVFAKYLAAASRMRVIAAISHAAAAEFTGWRQMLDSAGLSGPEIITVPLAATVPILDPADERSARERVLVDDLPLVLCVGSHEPRKNHLAVLQACEELWRSGEKFSLTLVGGNAWSSEEFRNTVEGLRAQGRPVQTIAGMADSELWWCYRLARLTVFPSLNEGFGLPIAESLYVGTPVVTSGFGSMAEVAEGGGCLLVDPRDDASIAAGIRSLLSDDEVHDRLAAEASARRPRGWAEYAEDLWRAMVN